MKRRFTDEQIIGFFKEAEAGTPVKELCRKHGFSDAAFYGWRSRFGGMEVAGASGSDRYDAGEYKHLGAQGLPTGGAVAIGVAIRADPF